jgi:hypothetical protein
MSDNHASDPRQPRNRVEVALDEAVRSNACMKIVCTTCGGTTMRGILLGQAIPDGQWVSADPPLTLDRAREVVAALRECSPNSDYEFVTGVRSLLHGIWLRFGSTAHAEIFPALDGSWAGSVLADMKRHFDQRMEARHRHDERQGVKKRDWKE